MFLAFTGTSLPGADRVSMSHGLICFLYISRLFRAVSALLFAALAAIRLILACLPLMLVCFHMKYRMTAFTATPTTVAMRYHTNNGVSCGGRSGVAILTI